MKKRPIEKQTRDKQSRKNIYTGIISITRNGTGFFMCEILEEDILIEGDYLGKAVNGDEVRVLRLPTLRNDRVKGKVLEVISRARNTFVGTIRREGKDFFLEADSIRMHTDILLPTTLQNTKLIIGNKAQVEIVDWDHHMPYAKVIKILGRAGVHETEMQAISLERGFEESFDSQIESTAEKLKEDSQDIDLVSEHREDFRAVITCTIDPDDAKDFDDALSVSILENGNYEIGIHIADVTHYVRPNDTIDKEARNRATSVYLVDRTIPMLPKVISNDLCSLNEKEDKRAFSAIFELDKNGDVQNERFTKTLINSNKRFTYASAQKVIDDGKGDFVDELLVLDTLGKTLLQKRIKKGAILFETDEVRFELDENGKPLKAFVKERLQTMKMIEEFMLLANRRVAYFIAQACEDKKALATVSIYRVHGEPNVDKLEELSIFLKALGYGHFEDAGQITSHNIAALMRDIKGTQEQAVIQSATLRSMAKATYTHKNIGHFSLGFKHYTHFTSPIRRYPDMMVHRIIEAHLSGTSIPKHEIDEYIKLAIHSSEREIEATQAERDSVKYKQVEYMSEHIGEVFDGVVTGVNKNGLFVAEAETRAEGFVPARSMDDWYELNEKTYSLVGKKGKTYRIGDTLRLKLKRTMLEDKQLDWEIVE